MADHLLIWLYDLPVAGITRKRGQLRLQYTEDALRTYEPGTPLLSLALPARAERYTHLPTRAFIDGLLPEGEPREVIARDLGINRDDSFRLIEALGRDCAGAIVIQPAEAEPPSAATTLTAKRLENGELAELIGNLRNVPLGAGREVRISLAGVQEKLLLTRLPDGSWGQPVGASPSTHILKPEIRGFASTVENEVFAMRLARQIGLDTANVEPAVLGERKLVVVERFDRLVNEDGNVERLHQEDFCQATGQLPSQKYEEDGGPSLREIADILQSVAPASTEGLLRSVVFNVAIGNGDAHAKNLALIHDPSGAIRLAPLYDLMSTSVYGMDKLAMCIDHVQRMSHVTVARIANEAASWGMNRGRALDIIADVLAKVSRNVTSVQSTVPALPEEIPDGVLARLRELEG